MILWHYVKSKHLDDIYKEGLKPGLEGVTYFCPTIRGCMLFSDLYGKIQREAGDYEYAFIPIELNPKKYGIKESYDHDRNYFNTKAFYTEKTIPVELLPKREDIKYKTYHSNGWSC